MNEKYTKYFLCISALPIGVLQTLNQLNGISGKVIGGTTIVLSYS